LQSSVSNKVLLICPSVGIWQQDKDFYFDQKFYDGIKVYKKYWPGKLKLLMRVDSNPPPEFGLIKYSQSTADLFELVILNGHEPIQFLHLKDIDVVLASADDFRQVNLAKLCQTAEVKCVYALENTFKTRTQITLLGNASLWQKFKSIIWLARQELRLRSALKKADGLQTNGMPAYKKYAKLVKNTLLYFDTRNKNEMLISSQALDARLDYLNKKQPLRLCFSGRLIAIKGVDDLLEVANELQNRTISFSMDIFGSGDLNNYLLKKIVSYNLQDKVFLRGAVDYETELVPFVKNNSDLFVCCHKQGDPSCTYLETYACGVPIIGYANDAHQGILENADVGWVIKIGAIKKLAAQIEILDKDREQVKLKAKAALKFAENHTFEKTFERRIQQCLNIMSAGQ
jgi:colanic acid/amylovoran biosynthesis glycosyltransferase